MLLCAAGCGRQVAVIPAPRPSAERGTVKPAPAAAQKAKPKPAPPPVAKPPAAAATKPVIVATSPAKTAKAPAAAMKNAKPATPGSKSAGKGKPKPIPVDSAQLERELIDQWEHAPLTYVLSRRSGNSEVADRAAAAVVYEAQRLNLSVSFVAAVLMIENTPMDSAAESVAGAIGLMQVMPMHSGGWGCPSDELQQVEANICHGTRLLNMFLRRYRTAQMALRRYNGCIGSRVTRSCLRYPVRVLRTAARIRKEMLQVPVDTLLAETEEPAPLPAFYLRRISFDLDSAPTDSTGKLLALRRYPAHFRR
jgi:soluble lytic murein transglycosylase-like protein